MSLELDNISLTVQGEPYLKDLSAIFERGSFNVVLGRTLAGKTSLLRLMAGLDRPSSGKVVMDGVDVTGVSVQKRKVSMVYQQFINYPNLSVFENIASPLRVAGEPNRRVREKVTEVAEMLHIQDYLQRFPLELSGGQQQRTAMARALVKQSDLILFDEPLVNLDYKLREELRGELRALLQQRNTIAVYASSDPAEALALGGRVAVLHEGELIQTGEVAAVYAHPESRNCAELFSEPPINLMLGHLKLGSDGAPLVQLRDGPEFRFDSASHLPKGDYVFGLRPHQLCLGANTQQQNRVELDLSVDVCEISGSETYLHLRNGSQALVAQLRGVHNFAGKTAITVYFSPDQLYVFDELGTTVQLPSPAQAFGVQA